MSKKDLKDTLNLPRTGFPMKAKLYENEPEMVKRWDREKTYEAVLEAHKDEPTWVLHDGPPYANGSIHLGTAMNKILKDMIVKAMAMTGRKTPYVPGWDCHGLPIEHQVDIQLGDQKDRVDPAQKRKLCREYADKYLDIQREEFKRMLVLGEWDNPYVTMDYRYEANIARELARFVKNGSVYRADRPVWWCPYHKTALAEAELEYEPHVSTSIYVRFPWVEDKSRENEARRRLAALAKEHGPVYLVIWTTTPWTIPGNLAIAVHPELDYVAVEWKGAVYVLAEGLANHTFAAVGMEGARVVDRFRGSDLEGQVTRHPLYERDSMVVLADYVTLEAGTGCVHTAPGHGREDYDTGLKYGFPIYSPVDESGRFTEDVEFFGGQFVFDANPRVVEKLEASGNLLWSGEYEHDYPLCWRAHQRPDGSAGKEPVISRATPQWFISMETGDLRKKALEEIRKCKWDPRWGEERIYGMIENRPDWCISRQRVWGVPIVAFHCKSCGEIILDSDVILHVADIFEQEGADAWFTRSADELLPEGSSCPACGGKDFSRDNAILDVWFDSGVSFACVCEERDYLTSPCDMYLEGSDQHRGWFHSSLLCATGTRGHAPYRTVLTHGYTVDTDGKKYSKSSGNYIPMDRLLKEFGAEILRMWTASENFRNDIRVSREIMNGISQTYRKVRNTLRYMLGNLNDFDPEKDALPVSELLPLDRWMVSRVERFKRRALAAYEKWEFHAIYHGLNQLCTVDLSAFYFDLVRDRLYCELPNGKERRSAQTAVYFALSSIVRLMAPVLAYTSEEVYDYLPGRDREVKSVHCLNFPEPDEEWLAGPAEDRMARVFQIQEEVNKALDQAQKSGLIGHPNDAALLLSAAPSDLEFLLEVDRSAGGGEDLARLFRVSRLHLCKESVDGEKSAEIEGLEVRVERAGGEKCERCWLFSTWRGVDPIHPSLCPRCTRVVRELTAKENRND
ncbi:MAG: isoleucine--tRNA ligase [bacterium]